jgi:hypothetical protein
MPGGAIGGLIAGMQAGRETNEKRTQSKHARKLGRDQEDRLRESQTYDQRVTQQAINEGATPGTQAGRSRLTEGISSFDYGTAPATPAAAPVANAGTPATQATAPATAAPTGGLIGPPEASAALPTGGLIGPPPAPPSAAGAAPKPVSARVKAQPAATTQTLRPGFGSMAAQNKYDAENRTAEIAALTHKATVESLQAEAQFGDNLLTEATKTLVAEYGDYSKALNAPPGKFFGSMNEILAEGFRNGLTEQQMLENGLQKVYDSYAAVVDQKQKAITASGKATTEQRQWLAETRLQEKAFTEQIILAMGGDMDAGLQANLLGVLEGAQLAVFNHMIQAGMNRVTTGRSGRKVALDVINSFANQIYPDGTNLVPVDTIMQPWALASAQTAAQNGAIGYNEDVIIGEGGLLYLENEKGELFLLSNVAKKTGGGDEAPKKIGAGAGSSFGFSADPAPGTKFGVGVPDSPTSQKESEAFKYMQKHGIPYEDALIIVGEGVTKDGAKRASDHARDFNASDFLPGAK